MSSIILRTNNAVSQQYAREEQAAVYGRYMDKGYAVNPLVAQAGGTIVPNRMSASEAFKLGGADFKVAKTVVHYQTPDTCLDEVMRHSTEHCAITRCDTGDLLGIMGVGYTPVQNDALIHLFDYLREDVEIDNILTVRNGRKVFVTASCNIEGEVTEGDKVRRYLHAFNSHDGSSSFGVFFSDIRLKCANQLNYLCGKGARKASQEGAGLVMRHTRSVEQFAAALPQLISVEQRKFEQDLSRLRPLTTLKLTPDMARHILESTYSDELSRPITDKDSKQKRSRSLADLPQIARIRSHYSGDTGIEIESGTAYGLFQAITQYETHDAGRAKEEIKRARLRLEALWGGAGSTRIAKAREACLALI